MQQGTNGFSSCGKAVLTIIAHVKGSTAELIQGKQLKPADAHLARGGGCELEMLEECLDSSKVRVGPILPGGERIRQGQSPPFTRCSIVN